MALPAGYSNPQTKFIGVTAAPTVNDDSSKGFKPGDIIWDETNDKAYLLVDAAIGAAVWKEFTFV